MSLFEKSFKGIIWSFIDNFGLRIVTIGTFFFLAKILGPEAFGLVAIATVFLSFSTVFVEFGVITAIVQKPDLTEENLSSTLWGNLAMGVLFFILTFLFAPLIAWFFEEPELSPILRVAGLVFITDSLSKVQEGILQKEFLFKALAKRRLIASLASAAVGIGMALLDYGVWSLVFQRLVFGFVQTLVIWMESPWKPKWYFSWTAFWEIFSFGYKMMFTNIVYFLNRHMDDLLVGYFMGPVILGYYAIAYKVFSTLTDLITNTIYKVILPLYSKLQDDKDKLISVFYQSTEYTSYASFAVFAGVIALAPFVVPLFFGDTWVPSIEAMQILAVVGMLFTITHFVEGIYLSTGNPNLSLKFNSLLSLFYIGLFFLAIEYGIEGIALSRVIGVLIVLPFMLAAMNKLVPFELKKFLSSILKPALAVLGAGGLFYLIQITINLEILWSVSIGIILGGILYAGLIYFLNPAVLQVVNRLGGFFRPKA
ncbi:MAG: lipopolysaccharide biosynthesis protein [Bacteroidia bacterium]|nr:lipopolysaccharide biosynthesis protein [Bacteroidia bacterium]